MNGQCFLDTNILLYTLDDGPENHAKQEMASALLERSNCALSVQVFQEFFHQATRPTRQNAISASIAWAFIETWKRFPVQENTLAILDNARALHVHHHFSIWDCLIIAAAQALGCTTLYSEDMQHGRIIDDLRIINPFR